MASAKMRGMKNSPEKTPGVSQPGAAANDRIKRRGRQRGFFHSTVARQGFIQSPHLAR